MPDATLIIDAWPGASSGVSYPLQESGWDPYAALVDPRERYDADWDWQRSAGFGPFATGRIEDREGGKNRPVFETESDLDDIRAAANIITETSPAAISALKNLTNFVIGKGFTYTAALEPKLRKKKEQDQRKKRTEDAAELAQDDQQVQEEDELPADAQTDPEEKLVSAVQVVIDEFLDANDWTGDYEAEIFRTSRRDGEHFLQILPGEQGVAIVRSIAPARVKEPKILGGYGKSTTFGVETPADDLCKPECYWVQWDSLDGQLEPVEASTVEHIKLNVDRGIKRGVSDFFAVDPDIAAARVLLRNMIQGCSVQAAIAYIVEHAQGTTKTQIEDIRSNNATLRYDQAYQTGTKTQYQQRHKPGTRLDVGKGQVYKGSPLASGEAATAYVNILQAGLRSIGSRWTMPEYMISGDASNGNYASTMVAESPFVKNCEVEQAFYKRRFLRVVWKAVEIAVKAGKIPGQSDIAEIKKLVEIQCETPDVAARDAEKETSRRKTLKDAGILSDKTWSSQEGLDYEQEQENIAQQPVPMAPVALGPDGKPLPVQAPPIGPPGAMAHPPAKQSAVAAALESVRTTAEAMAVLREAYP